MVASLKKLSDPNGKVVGIDIDPIQPIAGISTMLVDIEDPNVVEIIKKKFPFSFDVVLSDHLQRSVEYGIMIMKDKYRLP